MTYIDVDTDDLQNELLRRLRTDFERVRIVSVSVDGESFSDDDVIEITVVFEGSREDLVEGQPAGLFAIIRDVVGRFCRDGVPNPVLNFRSLHAIA